MNKLRTLAALPLVVMTYAMTSPAFAQAADLSADAITGEIAKARPIIIAVGVAIFGLVGLLVALRFGRKASGG